MASGILRKRKPLWRRPSKLIPTTLMPSSMLADTQAARGSLAQALATAERAVQQNPRDVRAYAVLGVLEEKSGNWQKAEETYQKAMQIDPNTG